MAIPTPQEFHKSRAEHLAPDVDRAVDTILAAMAKETPSSRYCIDEHKVMVPPELRDLVRRRFAESGWDVHFGGSYQGSWVEIKAAGKA